MSKVDQYIYLSGVDILRRKNDGFGAYSEQSWDAKHFAERLTRVRGIIEENVAYTFRYRYAYYSVLNKLSDAIEQYIGGLKSQADISVDGMLGAIFSGNMLE